MANTARQFVAEETAAGHESLLTNEVAALKCGADVVHIHGAWLPILWKVAKLAKQSGAKLVIRPAGSYDPVRRRYHGWKKMLVAPFEHAMLDRADVVQATCAQEAEWIRAYHPSAKVEVIDLRRFFKIEEGCKLPLLGNKGDGGLHVLYLGRRHPLKGVRYLERAVGEVTADAGSSGKRTGVRFPAGLELRLVSNAFGAEKEKVWQWCHVLCLPTLSENFGRVVAEALERGKRVIVTDGAPAWEPDEESGCSECSRVLNVRMGYGGRLLYLKGYREGSDETRVGLLKTALDMVLGKC